jgi:hypothetical protein
MQAQPGSCGQRVEFEDILAKNVQRRLLNGIKLREGGCSVALAGHGSYVEKGNVQLYLSCDAHHSSKLSPPTK